MTTDAPETPPAVIKARRALVANLSRDLTAAGWDQDCKLYFALGEDDDPYLEFIGDIDIDPTHWLMHRADEGTVAEHVQGIALMWESWVYPKELAKALDKDNKVSHAYRMLVPPAQHPMHADMRGVLLVMRDGYAVRSEHYSDAADVVQVAELNGRPKDRMPTGNMYVDSMRALLGSFSLSEWRPFASMGEAIANRPALQELIKTGTTEGWPAAQVSGELFLAMEPQIQFDMLSEMPEEVHSYLEGKSFDFESLTPPQFEPVDG